MVSTSESSGGMPGVAMSSTSIDTLLNFEGMWGIKHFVRLADVVPPLLPRSHNLIAELCSKGYSLAIFSSYL